MTAGLVLGFVCGILLVMVVALIAKARGVTLKPASRRRAAVVCAAAVAIIPSLLLLFEHHG